MTTDVPGDGAVLLTVVEAAKRLRIGRTKMYSLITSGAVKTVTIGALRRVPVEALPEYVARLLAEGSDNNEPAA
jgi:excisionase family DNA binding protein